MSLALYPTRTRAPRGVRTSATSASPLRGPARVPLSSSVIFVSSTYFGWRGGDRVRAAHAATAREKKRARALSYLRLSQDAVGLAGRFAAPCRRMSRRHCKSPAGWHRQTVSKILAGLLSVNQRARKNPLRKLMRERSSALALVLWCCATPGSLVERASRGPRPPREAGSWSPCCSRPMSSACARSL